MITEAFYLSNNNSVDRLMSITDLSKDEIEQIVGRFKSHSQRAGQLRGEVIVFVDDSVAIRHHFTKKILWRQDND